MNHHAIVITAKEQADLLPIEEPAALKTHEVRGNTLVTLISPGTEIAWSYLGVQQDHAHAFPKRLGYAAVLRAEQVGSEVHDLEPGTSLLCMGNHQSYQQTEALAAVPIPPELPAHEAVLARLMGVTMTTLMTTSARPGDLVVVTGAGPVGYLGAHLFALSGYDVCVVEPNERRRAGVQRSGITTVHPTMPLEDKEIKGQVALVLECSGHEQAALDGARI
ncbi:MAG TPA: dehydrogenase, partial [bacterium]|nr:dehydrogenase [bacterium]